MSLRTPANIAAVLMRRCDRSPRTAEALMEEFIRVEEFIRERDAEILREIEALTVPASLSDPRAAYYGWGSAIDAIRALFRTDKPEPPEAPSWFRWEIGKTALWREVCKHMVEKPEPAAQWAKEDTSPQASPQSPLTPMFCGAPRNLSSVGWANTTCGKEPNHPGLHDWQEWEMQRK